MRKLAVFLVLAAALPSWSHVPTVAADPAPLDVLYLSRTNDPTRTADFKEFLESRFRRCVVEDREDLSDEVLQGIDVVIFDWSQSERSPGTQSDNEDSEPVFSLGSLEQWSTPIVLLGSAGLYLADVWQVIGDAG